VTETNFRALCAEILQKLDQYEDGQRVDWDAWRNNTRASLVQPEPVAVVPTDDEIFAEATKFLYFSFAHMGDPNKWDGTDADLLAFARAVLALRVTPANNTGGAH
jgi:hypothetical protein